VHASKTRYARSGTVTLALWVLCGTGISSVKPSSGRCFARFMLDVSHQRRKYENIIDDDFNSSYIQLIAC